MAARIMPAVASFLLTRNDPSSRVPITLFHNGRHAHKAAASIRAESRLRDPVLFSDDRFQYFAVEHFAQPLYGAWSVTASCARHSPGRSTLPTMLVFGAQETRRKRKDALTAAPTNASLALAVLAAFLLLCSLLARPPVALLDFTAVIGISESSSPVNLLLRLFLWLISWRPGRLLIICRLALSRLGLPPFDLLTVVRITEGSFPVNFLLLGSFLRLVDYRTYLLRFLRLLTLRRLTRPLSFNLLVVIRLV